MDNHRILLYFTLFFIIYLLWAQWQMEYGPKPVEPAASQTSEQQLTGNNSMAAPEATLAPGTPSIVQPAQTEVRSSELVHVITDVVDVEIDTLGGSVVRVTLRDYAVEADQPEIKLDLLSPERSAFHVAQSGLVSVQVDTAPSHNTVFSAQQSTYRL